MLERLHDITWSVFAQPEWNRSDEIPNALLALSKSKTGSTAKEACNRVLYAVGNNHAGTYYPVALAIVPFLGEIIVKGPAAARLAALEILVDLSSSFEPETGFEFSTDVDGTKKSLSAQLGEVVATVVPQIETLAASAHMGSRGQALVRDLLAAFQKK